MINRIRPWLYLAVAILGLIGLLTEAHANGWFVLAKIGHLGISLSYVWPQIAHMLHHLHR
jgi:hypothetical protein